MEEEKMSLKMCPKKKRRQKIKTNLALLREQNQKQRQHYAKNKDSWKRKR